MQIRVKALTGNIITLDVEPTNTIQDVLDMVQAADVVTPQQTIAINILMHGVVHGGLRLVSDTGLEYQCSESCDVAALLDGDCCQVVVRKRFDDALQEDDLMIVVMLQDQYKAVLKITPLLAIRRVGRCEK
jgi:hypothetical protein